MYNFNTNETKICDIDLHFKVSLIIFSLFSFCFHHHDFCSMTKFQGQSVTPHKLENMHPLVHAKEVENHDVAKNAKG